MLVFSTSCAIVVTCLRALARRAAVGGAVEEHTDERGGLDAQARGSKALARCFETPPSAAWRRREVNARLFDELRNRRDLSPGARAISAEMASAAERASAGGAKRAPCPSPLAKLVPFAPYQARRLRTLPPIASAHVRRQAEYL
jgi:hypothetical protein